MASYPPEALFQAAKRYKKQIFYKDLKANRISQLMKVRCQKTIFDWSIARVTFREDHWYDIQTIGKSVYMLDENGLIHSFSYDEYDTVC